MRGRKPKAVAGMPKMPKLGSKVPNKAIVPHSRRRPVPGVAGPGIPADMGLLKRTPFRGIG